jgi:HD-like signal output (HDOD) protein
MTLPNDALLRKLEEVVERGDFVVPPYPAAAMRLRSLIESEKFGLAQIADAAAADPALAASLLRIANSPVYRGEGPPFTTLLRAVNRLGARSVSTLALAAGIGVAACAPGPLSDIKYRVWRRSITCALCAQKFAHGRGIDPEEAFLGGLLHGFGRSVAVACIEQLITSAPQKRSLGEWLDAVEPHRAELAQRVAQIWQLPDTIARAMADDSEATTPASTLVALADRIAGALDRGATTEELAKDPELKPAEAAGLERFINALPGALETFVQSTDLPNKKGKAPNAVTKPQSRLPGELRVFKTPVLDLRKGQTPERFESVALAPLGLVLTSSRPLQESCVIRVAVQTEPAPVEAWFNVVLCAPEGKRFKVELQAFAASGELREHLSKLWATAPKLD